MEKTRFFVTFLALALLGLGAGLSLHQWLNGDEKALRTLEERRPEFTLRDLDGQLRSVNEWDGKVLVVNFWATWCPPCRREIPAFIDLQETYGERGLQFVGVAIDDPEKVRDYGATYGINYPSLVGENDAIEVATRYGNRVGALPFTTIINREGWIVYRQQGELSKAMAEKTILPLL